MDTHTHTHVFVYIYVYVDNTPVVIARACIYTLFTNADTHSHTDTHARARTHTGSVSAARCLLRHVTHSASIFGGTASIFGGIFCGPSGGCGNTAPVTCALGAPVRDVCDGQADIRKSSLHLWSMCEYTRALSFENFVYLSISMGAMDGRTYLCIYVSIYRYISIDIYIYRYRYRYTFFN